MQVLRKKLKDWNGIVRLKLRTNNKYIKIIAYPKVTDIFCKKKISLQLCNFNGYYW